MIQILLGYLLDLIFGDPHWLPHPVRWIGRLIILLEELVYSKATNTKQMKLYGAFVAVITVLATAGAAYGVLYAAGAVHPYLRYAVEVWMVYTTLATCSLGTEAEQVRELLDNGDLEGARKRVGWLVSRDTSELDEGGVSRATVETVAENFSDGTAAPLFFIILGGPVLGMVYKAVNTLDSMLGYKNEKYLNFGYFAAKLDDVVNWIPSRLCGLFVPVGALMIGLNVKNSWAIFKRDRLNHASPNSGHPEAAFAGALGIQMGGKAVYFGQEEEKPTIGDKVNMIRPITIKKTVNLLYASSLSAIVMMGVIRFLFELYA